MKLIDTHTHLYLEDFDEDIDLVMKRANDCGVKKFYIPSIDSTYHERMFNLKKRFPDKVNLMMGLHPTHVKDNYIEELEIIKSHIKKKKFVAIGEIGIDLYWDKTFLKEQQDAFNYQIILAKEKGLPVIIHCRNAFNEVFEILESHRGKDLFGIFHCFTGSKENAFQAIDLNLKLGIGGVVTFINGKIDKFLNQIPIEEIVLETDSPYLAPAPYRGKRNESSYLKIIIEKVSECYHESIEKIAEITFQSSEKVFQKKK